MWKHSRFIVKRYQYLNFSNLQQAPKKIVPESAKLTHRFLEYFQKSDDAGHNLQQIYANNAPSKKALLEIDRKLCANCSNMTNMEILRYLTYYVLSNPQTATDFEFYKVSRSILSHRLNQLTPQELIQFMYVIAIKKKSFDAKKYMKKCLMVLHPEKIHKLSLTDLLILCNATFKTSIRIVNQELLRILENSLYDNLHLLQDPGMFITMVKTFRHNQCQSEELLITISNTIFFNGTFKCYNFAAITHILPLYVDSLYYDEQLFTLFVELALKQLKESEALQKQSYFQDNIRGKDIKRLLWCCSYINHQLAHDKLKLIEEKILERVDVGHYDDTDAESLIDSVFYLWMMEYQSPELLEHCKARIDPVRKRLSKSKIRVNMLLICMQLENIQLYKKFGHKSDVFNMDTMTQIENRPEIIKIYNVLKTIMSELDINRLEFEYLVPHINIVGITGYRKNIYKTFSVEMLDETNKVKSLGKEQSRTNGPLRLKMRLLYKMNLPVILIDAADIKDLHMDELHEFIKTEMIRVT